MRHTILLIMLAWLTACSQASERALTTPTMLPTSVPHPLPPRTAISAAIPPTAHALSTLAVPTDEPVPTFLPEQRIRVAIQGRTWWLTQPVGIPPLVAQGTQGILWVAFPYMRVDPSPAGTGEARPLDAYFIMYTPLTDSGNDLNTTGYRIVPLWSDTDQGTRSVIALLALDDNRFLLVSLLLCQGCQNGGTLEFWRVDPANYGQPEAFVSVLELLGEGGGHFVTYAIGPHWLVWNTAESTSGSLTQPSIVFALDLQTGRRSSYTISDPYGVEQAQWHDDGTFWLSMRQTHQTYQFNPDTGRVIRHENH